MTAADVLNVAYAMQVERADDADRLTVLTGQVRDGQPSHRLALDRELGLAPQDASVSATNPAGLTDLVPVAELSIQDLASRLLTA